MHDIGRERVRRRPAQVLTASKIGYHGLASEEARVVTIRAVCLPDDRTPLLALDRSLTTYRIYRRTFTERTATPFAGHRWPRR
jgi:hypothetical protein